MAGVLDQLMQQVWQGCLQLVTAGFTMLDSTAILAAFPTSGPMAQVRSISILTSLVVAGTLLIPQLVYAAIRGGPGMGAAATGIVRYLAAFVLTVVGVSGLPVVADMVTRWLLTSGLQTTNFLGAVQQLPMNPAAVNGASGVELGLVGLFGLLPAGFGYAVEMMYRYAAIVVLIATAPITAAGLVTRSTAWWFWVILRWLIAAILMKPALALLLVAGHTPLSGAHGLVGLLGAVALLWVALGCPWALYVALRCLGPTAAGGDTLRDHSTRPTGSTPHQLRWGGPTPAAQSTVDTNVTMLPNSRPHRRESRWPTEQSYRDVARWAQARLGRSLSKHGRGWVVGCAATVVTALVLLALERWWMAIAVSILAPASVAVVLAVIRRRPTLWPHNRAVNRSAVLIPTHPVAALGLTDAAPRRSARSSTEAWDRRHLDGPGLASRLGFHDGPTYRGHGRVCVLRDLAEDRWAATALWAPPEGSERGDRWPHDLASQLEVMLWSVGHSGLADRLSVLVRALPASLQRSAATATPAQNLSASGRSSRQINRGVSSVRYEWFITVSGPEKALRRAAMAAGGGSTGQAWAAYRVLDELDHARSGGPGLLRWLSSHDLAAAVESGVCPPAERSGPQTDSSDGHARFTSVAYTVRVPEGGAFFDSAESLLVATQHGERRCVAAHYDLLDKVPRPALDGATPRITGSDGLITTAPRGVGLVSPTLLRSRATRASIGVEPGAVGHLDIGCTVMTAITVGDHGQIDDHTTRFEQDAYGLVDLVRPPVQDRAIVAACVPVGIGPCHRYGAAR